jgi:hypothetical protein
MSIANQPLELEMCIQIHPKHTYNFCLKYCVHANTSMAAE